MAVLVQSVHLLSRDVATLIVNIAVHALTFCCSALESRAIKIVALAFACLPACPLGTCSF